MKFKPYDIKSTTEAQFVATMVVESIKLLDSYSSELKFKFLGGFVSHLVLSTLKIYPNTPCSKETLYKFTKDNLINVKTNIQHSIAVGFSNAMLLYSGMDTGYSCEIKPSENLPKKGLTH